MSDYAMPERAAWIHGRRVAGRSDFLKKLDGLPSDKKQVVIVQPHVSERMYQHIRSNGGSGGLTTHSEQFRLRMVETQLHSARAAVVALAPTCTSSAARRNSP